MLQIAKGFGDYLRELKVRNEIWSLPEVGKFKIVEGFC
jgi:hypothetical protein